MFVKIHWIQGATVLDKFREYYIRTASVNLIPAFIVSIIATSIINIKSVIKN